MMEDPVGLPLVQNENAGVYSQPLMHYCIAIGEMC